MIRMLRVLESLEEYVKGAKKKHVFELGEMYINSTNVVFILENTYKSFFDNAVQTIKGFKYASDRMKEEVERYLPSITKTFEVEDRLCMILDKTSDLVLLKDVLDYFDGKLDPKHVAWILSSLHNLSCYLSYAKLSHGDISLNTYFISPKFHSGVLLGGWWYATEIGKKMIGVPSRTYNLFSKEVKERKEGDPRTDLDLIRAIGRELLGDSAGINVSAPEVMKTWLRCITSGDAIKDYATWKNKIITAGFGGRYFTEMEVTPEQIYK